MKEEYGTIRPVASLATTQGGENMGVYRRGDKGWEVAVDTGERYKSGRKKYYRELVKTKKEAMQREKELLEEYQKVTQQMIQEEIKKLQNKDLPDSINFKDAAEEWLNMKKIEVRRTTFQGYQIIVEKHLIPYFRDMNIADITESEVRAYFAAKSELSSTTLRHHYSTLSMILRFKNNNCMSNIKRPRFSNFEAKVINNIEELEELINNLKGTVAYLPSKFAALAGMRMSEIAGLQWQDLDSNNNILRVRRSLHWTIKDGKKGEYYLDTTKTQSSVRAIFLSLKFVEELKELKENRQDKETDFICRDTNGNPIFRQNIYDSFKRKVKKLGYSKLRFHDLRHSHATIAIHQFNVDAKTVQERLGHSTVTTTLSIYTAKSREQDKKVADKFDF